VPTFQVVELQFITIALHGHVRADFKLLRLSFGEDRGALLLMVVAAFSYISQATALTSTLGLVKAVLE
jgi:hypothetical protein